jgi:hypothetical protein
MGFRRGSALLLARDVGGKIGVWSPEGPRHRAWEELAARTVAAIIRRRRPITHALRAPLGRAWGFRRDRGRAAPR